MQQSYVGRKIIGSKELKTEVKEQTNKTPSNYDVPWGNTSTHKEQYETLEMNILRTVMADKPTKMMF